ncbi:sigma-54-dependent Fis family transcriptional regulator [Aneurinibacillus tyrosinisolvens]|uniref:sigma-54-dependent Fis family transcriptional regulator n=1 Tax=Aneurinibacillus tyrosinisolvens TaxID=1443435 RepID=UPI00069C47DA|nr:sigma-54-dependent Fis family transcriptional regulator [Aneurinibacillus tyrosinisolvens]
MLNVADCMTHNFVALQSTSTIRCALEGFLSYRLDIGCILDRNGELEGIITKYNLYRMLLNGHPLDTSIAPYLIHDVTTVMNHTSLESARDTLIAANVAHAVVLDENKKVVGVMAKGDLIQGFLLGDKRLSNHVTSLIENLEDAVISIDNDSFIHTFNSAAERMFQLSREAVLGRPAECIPQVGTETVHELQTTKKLERTLESALEIAYDGIVITDELDRVTMVNDALLELYSLSREDLLGTKAASTLPELASPERLDTKSEQTGDICEIKGNKCIVTCMPIIQKGKSVGAIIKVMFRQLDSLKDLFRRLDHLENELTYYRGEYFRATTKGTVLDSIITINPEMETLKKQTYLAAQGFSTVLITGESGTGKELFAQAIHEISGRPGNFVKVNCAAIPGELLESEFFGYADGAFTGARKGGKPGKFEMADGGTLFLDEIGDMPLSLQAKLLRVLQERAFERIGDTRTTQVNVRIVAATNKQLEKLIAEGKFREDLYYRLNVIPLSIPPLRKRKEDLPLLCDFLIQKLNRMLGKQVQGINDSALKTLQKHSWPGNVRELENILERAINLGSGHWIEPHHLPSVFLSEEQGAPIQAKPDDLHSVDLHSIVSDTVALNKRDVIAATEKELILKALRESEGNRSAAAARLGVSRSTLYQKMRKYQIEEKSYFESL